MSPAHPTEARDGAEMCSAINPVQLLAKRNQVRQKKPSTGMIYSAPSSQPRCSRRCYFHLPLCWGHIHAVPTDGGKLELASTGTGTGTAGTETFVPSTRGEGGAKQRKSSDRSRVRHSVPLTKIPTAPQD